MNSVTKKTLDDYVQHRLPPGGFVTAVLENNLQRAIGRADLSNQRDIVEIVKYVYNYLPMACWGSPEKVSAWLKNETPKRKELRVCLFNLMNVGDDFAYLEDTAIEDLTDEQFMDVSERDGQVYGSIKDFEAAFNHECVSDQAYLRFIEVEIED